MIPARATVIYPRNLVLRMGTSPGTGLHTEDIFCARREPSATVTGEMKNITMTTVGGRSSPALTQNRNTILKVVCL